MSPHAVRRLTVLIPCLAWACSASEGLRATGQVATFHAAHRELLATDGDRGAITIVSVDTGETREVPVGVDPARIALVGDTAYVSLRGQRAWVALVRTIDGWVVDRRVPTGTEPLGLAVDEAAARVYVAASTTDLIEVYDAGSGARLSEIAVPGRPRTLTLHPSGDWLYVTTERHGLFAVELPAGEVRSIEIPRPMGPEGTGREVRITGDPALSPDGARLSLPASFVDTTGALGGRFTGPVLVRSDLPASYYNVSPDGLDRFAPTVIDVPLDGDGEPDAPITNTMIVVPDARLPSISSLTYEADDDGVWVGFDGFDQAIRVEGDPAARPDNTVDRARRVSVPSVPTHLAAAPGALFVASTLSRTIARIDPRGVGAAATAATLASRAPSPLGARAEHGRALFFSGSTGPMSAGGVSCASCHTEGRTDGTTWRFGDRGRRQTPSLAERVSERAPLRWGGDRESVAVDTLGTAAVMGGTGLTEADAADVQAYVDTIRGVDLPLHGVDDAEIRAGRALFEEVGCASCHAGELLTDRTRHALVGRDEVQTPSLIGVAATAPFLSDGAAADLAEVIAGAEALGHGRTGDLSEAERAALERYLESL